MADNNAVGERGESIFRLALTELVGAGAKPYFRACSQGEKWPVTDFYCELLHLTGYGFLVQVKTTYKPIVPGSHVPIAKLHKEEIELLFKSPMPFYLVAVHEPTEEAYIGVPRNCRSVDRVPTSHQLRQKATLEMLKKEVEQYWNQVPLTKFDPSKSLFAF